MADDPAAATAAQVPGGRFSVATLNLRKGMRVPGLRHDIRQVLDGGASVIGFQERLFSRPALRASLPKSWTLLMPSGPTGTDDNPIAFDKDVWELEKTWPALLAGTTWRPSAERPAWRCRAAKVSTSSALAIKPPTGALNRDSTHGATCGMPSSPWWWPAATRWTMACSAWVTVCFAV